MRRRSSNILGVPWVVLCNGSIAVYTGKIIEHTKLLLIGAASAIAVCCVQKMLQQ